MDTDDTTSFLREQLKQTSDPNALFKNLSEEYHSRDIEGKLNLFLSVSVELSAYHSINAYTKALTPVCRTFPGRDTCPSASGLAGLLE
jgi:hypothetical protein